MCCDSDLTNIIYRINMKKHDHLNAMKVVQDPVKSSETRKLRFHAECTMD